MRKISVIVFLVAVLLFAASAYAQNKVVVIPLGSSSAKGTDKQFQYNDNGKTAGATVYYDKANGYVGINTPSPAANLHILSDDTPKIFLDQDGGKYPPSLWAIGGNELGFSVVDMTHGYNAIFINSTGAVGIGTNSPTSKLEVRGEILSTDGNGAARLWGEGRPGVSIYNNTWTDSTTTGIQVASGTTYVTWGGVAAGCPVNTWVCTLAERGTGAVATPDTNFTECDGTTSSSITSGVGRVADASLLNAAWARDVFGNGTAEHGPKCLYSYAWCCRDKP